jgi:hypothetical protein
MIGTSQLIFSSKVCMLFVSLGAALRCLVAFVLSSLVAPNLELFYLFLKLELLAILLAADARRLGMAFLL